MKHKSVIQIITESYEEEQFILGKFPEAWWTTTQKVGHTTFYVSELREGEVKEAINEYKERSKK